jgi:hypothetical protein
MWVQIPPSAPGRLAQLVEHFIYTEGVIGSSPIAPTHVGNLNRRYVARTYSPNRDERSEEAMPSGNSSSPIAPTHVGNLNRRYVARTYSPNRDERSEEAMPSGNSSSPIAPTHVGNLNRRYVALRCDNKKPG